MNRQEILAKLKDYDQRITWLIGHVDDPGSYRFLTELRNDFLADLDLRGEFVERYLHPAVRNSEAMVEEIIEEGELTWITQLNEVRLELTHWMHELE